MSDIEPDPRISDLDLVESANEADEALATGRTRPMSEVLVEMEQSDRFYVQDPHVDGLAVIDREKSALVISSFGDTSSKAAVALQRVARGLNAATAKDWDVPPTQPEWHRNDALKAACNAADGALAWRVVEYLSSLYRERTYAEQISVADQDEYEYRIVLENQDGSNMELVPQGGDLDGARERLQDILDDPTALYSRGWIERRSPSPWETSCIAQVPHKKTRG